MKKKYLGISALLAGIALTAAICHGTTASALSAGATPPPQDPNNKISGNDIVVDYATQTLQVTTTDAEVLVGFPTVKIVKEDPDDEGEIDSIQVKKWDVYDSDEMTSEEVYDAEIEDDITYYTATIDLSPINITKGGYVAVKTNVRNNSVLIHFAGIHNKLSASYDQETETVTVIDKANDGEESENVFEYKTQYGDWQEYDANDDEIGLKRYAKQGATLYFREKCGVLDKDWKVVTRGEVSADYIAEDLGYFDPTALENNYYMYEAQSTFSGKELKVKIPKLKDGPTVKMNYAKRTITIKKNTLYRQDVTKKFVSTPTDSSVDISIGDEAGVLEVRTPEVQAKKYTPASKIAHYEYPASRRLNVKEDANGYVGKKAGDLTLTYNATSKKVECSSTDLVNTYQLYAVKTGAQAPVIGDKATATIKPTKDAMKPTVVSLALSKVPVGSRIYVAYAADTKTQRWATTPVLLGTVTVEVK